MKVQRSTPYQELPKAAVGKLIADPIVEKAIRAAIEKPEGELTKADYEKLKTLWFYNKQLTSVKGLEKLTQLTRVNLWKNQLAEVPKGLDKLTQLERLNLSDNQLTDVKGLEKLTQLEMLSLRNNKLTDVKGLEKLTKLGELYLSDNKLTDVKGLEKLTQLKRLSLRYNPDLTKAQIDQLQKALPRCDIQSKPKMSLIACAFSS